MANVPDNKKGWTFLKKFQMLIASIEADDAIFQDLKAKWVSQSPNISSEGFPMSGAELAQANAMLEAHNTYLSDFSTTITMIKSKNTGSHEGNALD